MSIKTSIKDGTGKDLEVKVKKAGAQDEESLCVNVTGTSSGSFLTTAPYAAGGQYEEYLTEDGLGVDNEMGNVDYSSTNKTFKINALADKDLIVTSITILGLDSSIKMDNWMGRNSPLSTGSVMTIKSDNQTTTLSTFFSTFDILAFSTEGGFDIFYDNAGDSLKSLRRDTPLYILRAQDTFGTIEGADDFISFTLNDSWLGITSFRIQVRGILAEPGVF